MAIHEDAVQILRRLGFADDEVESDLTERLMIAQDSWELGLVTDEELVAWRRGIIIEASAKMPFHRRRVILETVLALNHLPFF